MNDTVTLNNVPIMDLARMWLYPLDYEENGEMIYPDMDSDEMVDEWGYPSLLSMGNFYWKCHKLAQQGRDLAFSRWSRFQTPPDENGVPQDIFDGDIIRIVWIEPELRELISYYTVDYFNSPEGRWVLNEIGDHEDREYLPLAEIDATGRKIKEMKIIGNRWNKKKGE